MEYHEKPSGLKRWLFTTNHREIGILYMITAVVAFFIGGAMAMIVRLELMTPEGNVWVYDETYNALMSMHAITMIFLFVMPMFAGMANYLVPLMIGAKDMAFPRINALSYWLIPPGAILIWCGFLFQAFGIFENVRPAAGGWTLYVPLSSACSTCSPGLGVDLLIVGLQLLGVASVLGAINFIVTIVRMRRPGMTMHKIPLFCWAMQIGRAHV